MMSYRRGECGSFLSFVVPTLKELLLSVPIISAELGDIEWLMTGSFETLRRHLVVTFGYAIELH